MKVEFSGCRNFFHPPVWRSAHIQRETDCLLNRGIIAVSAGQFLRQSGKQGRLRHEARPGAAVRLRGVEEEGMAEIDCAGISNRVSFFCAQGCRRCFG